MKKFSFLFLPLILLTTIHDLNSMEPMDIDTKTVSAAHTLVQWKDYISKKASEIEERMPKNCVPLDLCKIIAEYNFPNWKLVSSLPINNQLVQKQEIGLDTQKIYALTYMYYKNKPTIISGASNSDIQIWDLHGKIHAILKGHTSGVCVLAYVPSKNMLISGSRDKRIRLWKLDEDLKKSRCIKALTDHTNWICSLAVSPDETIFASGSLDTTARLWSLPKGTPLHTFQHNTNDETEDPVGVWWNHDGTLLLSAVTGGSVCIWNPVNKGLLKEFTYLDRILGLSTSSITNHMAISTGRRVFCANITGEIVQTMESPNCEGINSKIVFSPLGTRLASIYFDSQEMMDPLAANGVIRIWDVPTGVLLAQLPDHQALSMLCFVSEDLLIASEHNKTGLVDVYSTLD